MYCSFISVFEVFQNEMLGTAVSSSHGEDRFTGIPGCWVVGRGSPTAPALRQDSSLDPVLRPPSASPAIVTHSWLCGQVSSTSENVLPPPSSNLTDCPPSFKSRAQQVSPRRVGPCLREPASVLCPTPATPPPHVSRGSPSLLS